MRAVVGRRLDLKLVSSFTLTRLPIWDDLRSFVSRVYVTCRRIEKLAACHDLIGWTVVENVGRFRSQLLVFVLDPVANPPVLPPPGRGSS